MKLTSLYVEHGRLAGAWTRRVARSGHFTEIAAGILRLDGQDREAPALVAGRARERPSVGPTPLDLGPAGSLVTAAEHRVLARPQTLALGVDLHVELKGRSPRLAVGLVGLVGAVGPRVAPPGHLHALAVGAEELACRAHPCENKKQLLV